MKLKNFGFTYKIDNEDINDKRVVEFKKNTEVEAEKEFDKWIRHHGFIKCESLGERI